jgi:hypothetical protein
VEWTRTVQQNLTTDREAAPRPSRSRDFTDEDQVSAVLLQALKDAEDQAYISTSFITPAVASPPTRVNSNVCRWRCSG